MSVRKDRFKDFIETFLKAFAEYAKLVRKEIREETFPKFFLSPYKINCVISNTHGLSIEFLEKSTDYQIAISKVNNPIEEAVLPQKNSRKPCLEIANSRFIDLVNLVIVTKEFREKYIKEMTGGIVCQKPLDGFLHVSSGGDVKVHNSFFGAIIEGKPIHKKTGDCLWIYGSNKTEDFTVEKAKERALEEFNVYFATKISKDFKIDNSKSRRKTKAGITKKINEFKKLTSQPKVSENEIQTYLEKNIEFLKFGTRYIKIHPQLILERENQPDLIPDFLLERVTDGYCDILDIKLPDKKILVGSEQRRRFSCDVEGAIAQVNEYREFFNDPANREKVEKKFRVKILKPNMIVLIGDSTNIDAEELIKIRDRRKDTEVVTYSDLIKNMKALLDIIENVGV